MRQQDFRGDTKRSLCIDLKGRKITSAALTLSIEHVQVIASLESLFMSWGARPTNPASRPGDALSSPASRPSPTNSWNAKPTRATNATPTSQQGGWGAKPSQPPTSPRQEAPASTWGARPTGGGWRSAGLSSVAQSQVSKEDMKDANQTTSRIIVFPPPLFFSIYQKLDANFCRVNSTKFT